MRLKSYYAGTVESAMRIARQELGEDAMLMNSRKVPAEARHLGEYEVVFATTSEPPPQPVTPQHRSTGLPSPAGSDARSASLGALADEVSRIRQQLERMASAASRPGAALPPQLASRPEISQALNWLAEMGVEAELSLEVAQALAVRFEQSMEEAAPAESSGLAGPHPLPPRVIRMLAEELERRFEVSAGLASEEDEPKVIALVGPPGSGKTTTLVKLAVQYGVAQRRLTQLISMDNYRISAADQLRTYAAILGVGFQALATPAELSLALEHHRHKGLILIDTPGIGGKEFELAQELAEFLKSRPQIDTHLTLSSSMKSADLTRVVNRYLVFGAKRLLFTRLDETETYGPILNEAVRTGLPISFLATGQQVPEDLEAATKARIIELLLGRQTAQEAAAAR